MYTTLSIKDMTILIQKKTKKIPNKETQKAFDESTSNKLTIYNDIDELFNKLDKLEKNSKNENN
jgi:hypothetical protein